MQWMLLSQTDINECKKFGYFYTPQTVKGIHKDLKTLDFYNSTIIPAYEKSIVEYKDVIVGKNEEIKSQAEIIDTLGVTIVKTNELMKINEDAYKKDIDNCNFARKILKEDNENQAKLLKEVPKALQESFKEGKKEGKKEGGLVGFIAGVSVTIIGGLLIF